MTNETNNTCAALLEACSGFFSPILLATIAVAAILIPIAIEYITESTDSVSPLSELQNRFLSDVLQNTDQPMQIQIP
jgi:hypothetical protein